MKPGFHPRNGGVEKAAVPGGTCIDSKPNLEDRTAKLLEIMGIVE